MSTYTPIASQTLGSATSSVSFTSIPQGYTDLVVVIGYKAATTNYPTLRLTFNGSATGYSGTQLYGTGSTAGSNRTSNAAYISIARAVGVPQTVGNTGTIIINLQNYSNATTYKTVLARANASDTGTEADVGLWQNTSAITSFSIDAPTSNDFASGSTFSVYGIQVGQAAQKAQGGNIVTTDGTYVYHTFTSSGSFIPNEALTADYLVVAGGGGGSGYFPGGGGGGGAGGYRTSIGGSALSLTAKSYPVIVGAGGTAGGAGNPGGLGGTGNNSIFATITSAGGGYGGVAAGGGAGGSGGGAGGDGTTTAGSGNTPSTSPAQGFNGGAGAGGASYSGAGGGGGASAAGATGTGFIGGNGGAGTANSISGTSITYAGGGGGGIFAGSGRTPGTGGAGGGGDAGSDGVAGTANTGGGGGGGNYVGSTNYAGGKGGSGIVIIRYAI